MKKRNRSTHYDMEVPLTRVPPPSLPKAQGVLHSAFETRFRLQKCLCRLKKMHLQQLFEATSFQGVEMDMVKCCCSKAWSRRWGRAVEGFEDVAKPASDSDALQGRAYNERLLRAVCALVHYRAA